MNVAGLDADPIAQLQRWRDDAAASESGESDAMCVATVDAAGRPSARMVLLRGLDERGLRFFTSYESHKGRELAENPHAAAVFYWPHVARQVRVEGVVERVSDDESDTYFAGRPRGHQLAAWASEQSEPIEARGVLEERFAHFDDRFAEDDAIPRPHSWGGYRIKPARFEFWQGRPDRLHDRFEYVREHGGWRVARLQP